MESNVVSFTEITQDLFGIHTERIKLYTQALQDDKETELDIRSIFERIIEQSIKCRQQLNKTFDKRTDNKGDVYKAWAEVKIKAPAIEGSKKTIAATCLEDDLAVLNAYSLALSFVTDKEIQDLLLSQQQELQQLHAHIRQYHDAQ